MIRWPPEIPAPISQRWQSREKILKAYLDSLTPYELLRVRPDYWALRFGPGAVRREHARKANFNSNQPRVPAGNPDGGQWTSEGGVEVTTSPGFLTGIETIDRISQTLSNTLVRVMEALQVMPDMSPQQYGTAVHLAFAEAVRFQDLSGIGFSGVEKSFSLEDSDPRYGLAGTIRTDVVLRDDRGEIIAIYDVKTGDRPLSSVRADELRTKSGAAPGTPVFELNILRGISRKAQLEIIRPRDVRFVRLRSV